MSGHGPPAPRAAELDRISINKFNRDLAWTFGDEHRDEPLSAKVADEFVHKTFVAFGMRAVEALADAQGRGAAPQVLYGSRR